MKLLFILLSLFATTAYASGVGYGKASNISYGSKVSIGEPGLYHWEPFRGEITTDTVAGGQEPGRVLYICQANYHGGKYPGKLVDDKCNITFQGMEIPAGSFKLLLSDAPVRWVKPTSRKFPRDAVVGGIEMGQLLYICQAHFAGGMHPGKLVGGNCYIGYGGNEVQIPRFRVLVLGGSREGEEMGSGSSVNYGSPH